MKEEIDGRGKDGGRLKMQGKDEKRKGGGRQKMSREERNKRHDRERLITEKKQWIIQKKRERSSR